jgi:transcriptional regulator with XRE-family HTH domain
MYISIMTTLQELGQAVSRLRKERGLTQAVVASQAGITKDLLSRFERGALAEMGSRKLLAVLTVLGAELSVVESGLSGTLDELRRERGAA